jgi:signal transduction histidine kinase
LDEPEYVLATEPPTSGQRRLALAILAAVLVVFGATVAIGLTAPVALIPVRIPYFVPVLTAIFFVNDVITATLLFGQFSIIRSHALLVLASAYLFTGPMAVLFALTFPGVFSRAGLLGADFQSAAWIYNFWHYGFPLAVIVYATLIGRAGRISRWPARSAIGCSIAIVLALVIGLALLSTTRDELLPALFQDNIHPTPLARIVTSLNTFICVIALCLLYIRRRSVLDLWLIVVMCAWVSELAILDVLLYPRFSFGFYVGRGFSLVTSVIILVVLLAEMTRLYARLARSNRALKRERENKLMNMEAMVASIRHEVKQPLTTIAAHAETAIELLGRVRPDIDEARSDLNEIVNQSHVASEVFDNLRLLFARAEVWDRVDVNEIALQALNMLRVELEEHRITVGVQLASNVPLIAGHKGQLREVILNLLHNAVEALEGIKDESRAVRVITKYDDNQAIFIAIEDTGPGINTEELERIFDAFVTTKCKGMGLGLTICRMIVEGHGGRISALSDRKRRGALFQFSLPIRSGVE